MEMYLHESRGLRKNNELVDELWHSYGGNVHGMGYSSCMALVLLSV